MLRGYTRRFKPLEILTQEQVQDIYRGVLDVLGDTGAVFHHREARQLFRKHGCKIDEDKMQVRFPPGLVEECLRRCPSSFRVKARDPKRDLVLGGSTLYFSSSPGMQTVDIDTWQPRDPTKQEYIEGVKVLDALPSHHLICCYTPYFGYQSVPEVMKIPEGFALVLKNSTVFPMSGFSEGCEVFNIEMAKVAGTESLVPAMMAASPLTYYTNTVDCAYRVLEAGFPIGVDTGPVFGATSPATVAGSLVSCIAEIVAGIVFIQLAKPGARVFVFGFPWPMNMRNGAPNFGEIQTSLFSVAYSQVWRHLNIPFRNTSAGYSSSKIIDVQNGYEKSIPAVLSALSGAHLVHIHGGLYGELTHHPLQSIIDDDIAGMIGRFLEGIDVSPDTLALELIHSIGPIPGSFIQTEHTKLNWKKEQFIPKAADRLTLPEWLEKGRKTALDYAKERMKQILATHQPLPLSAEQEREIEKILLKARAHYAEKGLL
jgi:trimethylamine--corrinoid protein Co-methyltransferase